MLHFLVGDEAGLANRYLGKGNTRGLLNTIEVVIAAPWGKRSKMDTIQESVAWVIGV